MIPDEQQLVVEVCRELLRTKLTDGVDETFLHRAGIDPGVIYRLRTIFSSPTSRANVILAKRREQVVGLLLEEAGPIIEKRKVELRAEYEEKERIFRERLREERLRQQEQARQTRLLNQKKNELERARKAACGAVPVHRYVIQPPLELTPMEMAVYGV